MSHPILHAKNPDRQAIRKYLDESIRFWREDRDEGHGDAETEQAIHYIDAFQSVRKSLLGETLP